MSQSSYSTFSKSCLGDTVVNVVSGLTSPLRFRSSFAASSSPLSIAFIKDTTYESIFSHFSHIQAYSKNSYLITMSKAGASI